MIKKLCRCRDGISKSYRTKASLRDRLEQHGNSLRYLLEFGSAEEAFANALKYQPNYANAYKNRAALRATQGDIEVACEDYQQALAIQPNDPNCIATSAC